MDDSDAAPDHHFKYMNVKSGRHGLPLCSGEGYAICCLFGFQRGEVLM